MVATITSHKKIISTNAMPGFFIPKNRIDHSVFKNNCTPNKDKAIFTSFFFHPCCHTKKAAIPMSTNSVVHTGPNTQLGGLNEGLFKVAYQVGIEDAVKIEPITPAISESATKPRRGAIFFRVKKCFFIYRKYTTKTLLHKNRYQHSGSYQKSTEYIS